MKTIYKKYIRNNWYWLNREPILYTALIIVASIALLHGLEILIDKI